jgi:hypothetical protein
VVKGRRWITATTFGLLAAIALSSPAAAATLVKKSGQVGDYGTFPHSDKSEARCGFVDDPGNLIDLKWINVYAPGAGPAASRTSQKVTWSVTIQSRPRAGGSWTKVASSATQTGTATNTTNPSFTAIKVHFQAVPDMLYRSELTISWITHGSVSGYVKLAPEWYATDHNGQHSTVVLGKYCPGRFTG